MSRWSIRPIDALLFVAVILIFHWAWTPEPLSTLWPFDLILAPKVELQCSPEDFAAGQWVRKTTPIVNITKHDDVYAASGFTGCGSTAEHEWHLATQEPSLFKWRSQASHWDWQPDAHCRSFTPLRGIELVRHLVELGGWMMIGDSLTEGHFFSISCELHPHVRAVPQFAPGENYDRGAPQTLYLANDSWLIPHLNFPPGFSIELTPLVSFRRVDALLAPEELVPLFAHVAPWRADASNPTIADLYGNMDEVLFNWHSAEQFANFTSPPPLNWGAMIVSTGAHWTESVFRALEGEDEIVLFFYYATQLYLARAAEALNTNVASSRPKWGTAPSYSGLTATGEPRRVIIRAATRGTENCLSDETRDAGPIPEVKPLSKPHWNWEWIPRLNEQFAAAVAHIAHPQIHWLPIERPAQLRADSHVIWDCLHLTTGTGAMESWTDYISHFLWKERHA